MNLLLFLLSFLFASYAPTQTVNDSSDTPPVKKNDTGKGKGGKFGDGDYIIWNDIMP